MVMDVASNAIAFVGLADVTLRTGSKIFDFLAAIKDAPHEIETLQRELGTINSLVAEVKASCEDPTGGQPWSLPSQALVDCTCLLKAIHQDLKILALAASNYDASKAFASTWAKIKWVFADKQVSRLSRRLESNKLSLVAALTLYERRSALLNQERMQQTIIQKSDHVLSHVIDGSEQCIKGLRELRITVSADHTRLEETARRLEKSASTIEEAVQSLPWRIQRPRVVLEKCINPKSKVAQRFGQTFEQISQLGQPAISIRSPFTNDCQDVLLSLLLIQRQLSGVFVHLNGAKDSEISKVQSNWICSEVQLFITTAIHESSDTMSCGQGPGSMTSFNPSTEDSMGVDDFASSPGRAFDLSQRLDAVRGRQKITNRVWRFETAFGCLNISKSIRRESDVGLREEFRVSFIPSLDTHSTSTAIIANFRKMFSRMKSPQIVRQLHAYTLIPYGASHGLYDIVESGSLREIANAFTTGRASPFVLDFLGRPIHYIAARAGRLDLLKYLAGQGLGPASVNGGSYALRGLCELWQNQAYKPLPVNEAQDIFHWLINNGCDVNYCGGSEGSVQYVVSDPSDVFQPATLLLYQHWISLLLKEDYDLDTRNFAGETALLEHASLPGAYSAQVVLLLVQKHADISATNPSGHNALICAMSSIKMSSEKFRSVVFSKLVILIRAGCGINQRDKSGLPPSYHAIKNQCWYEWCLALEYNGFDFGATSLTDRPCRVDLSSRAGWGGLQLPVNRNLSKEWLEPQTVANSIAVAHYNRWKRKCVSAFIYFWRSVENIKDSKTLYPFILYLCNDSDISVSRYRYTEDLHHNLAGLATCYPHLVDLLLVFDRSIPNQDFKLTRGYSNGQFRDHDRIDDAITALRQIRSRYWSLYGP